MKTSCIHHLLSIRSLLNHTRLHHAEPVLGQHARTLQHHPVVEEAHKDKGDGELHNAVKSLEEAKLEIFGSTES